MSMLSSGRRQNVTTALINGKRYEYDLCSLKKHEYDLCSLKKHEYDDTFKYIGKGKVYSINGIRQDFGDEVLHFYKRTEKAKKAVINRKSKNRNRVGHTPNQNNNKYF